MSTIIILGVAMFTFVILALVFVLLAAKAKLVNSEAVTIGINHDPNHSLRVPAGNTLLNTLASNKIFIPSACGGKGSCGVCKVIVKSGGGSINPTELGYISKGEAREGCRLSCQVKVKQDMENVIPMDRLICGDVGFGKTEVAMRAAFKAIKDGRLGHAGELLPDAWIEMSDDQRTAVWELCDAPLFEVIRVEVT